MDKDRDKDTTMEDSTTVPADVGDAIPDSVEDGDAADCDDADPEVVVVGDGSGGSGGSGSGGGGRAGKRSGDRVKGPWSPEEDAVLSRLVSNFGARNWSLIARGIPGRSGKSCRLRWCNQLDPAVKRKPFTANWSAECAYCSFLKEAAYWAKEPFSDAFYVHMQPVASS